MIDSAIESKMKYARVVAYKMQMSIGCRHDLDDLESAGYLGLSEVIARQREGKYDDDMHFMNSCYKRIVGAMIDHIRKNRLLSRGCAESADRVNFERRKFFTKHGYRPDAVEMARALRIELDEYFILLNNITIKHEPFEDDIPDINDDITIYLQKQRNESLLRAARALLNDRERHIVDCYYQLGLGLREIGEGLSLSEVRVHQLLKVAQDKIASVFPDLNDSPS